jgi:predicted RNA binding protein YcfA (HicA-like mRNA interferase family)
LKVRDVIRLVRSDGWREVRTAESHRQFRHPKKRGVVTIAGKPGLDVPVGTLKSILKQAGLKS